MRIFTKLFILFITLSMVYLPAKADEPKKDKGKIIESKNEFWDEIKKSVEDFEKDEDKPRKKMVMDFSGYDFPKSVKDFKTQWHNDPVSQGWSGMCWCYSTTSMLESEIFRIHKKKIKLSELHTIYWEYVEKAMRFVDERGNSKFAEGSQANAVLRIWDKYGCVPANVYTGLKKGQTHHGHKKMFNEMNDFLQSVKKSNMWNKGIVKATIRQILNKYIGRVPENFKYEGKEYTPKQFMDEVVKLNMDDYIDVMSLKTSDYWQKALYDVPDNWWRSERYNNVPLDDFMAAIKKAMKNGYTMFIGGDVSEPGYESHAEVAMVPTFDIPSEYIDENARLLRFMNGATTDDHGIHIVGWMEKDGATWFLIKDSGSGSRNGNNKGYYFYHEDYIKLKMMNFVVHKSAIEDLMKKFKN